MIDPVLRTIFAGPVKTLGVVLVAALMLSACGPPSHPDVEQVAEGVFVYRSGTQRSLFMVTKTGVIVTDPLNVAAAASYREAISEFTDLPVKFVVYSHYHWDRVAGAQVFKDEGAEIIAQARCAERFEDNPNPAIVMPDRTFLDRYEIDLGGMSLGLYYFGPSHGDCLTVFLVRPAKLMQIVDLVNPPAAAFPADPMVPYIRPHNLRQFFAATEKVAKDYGVEQIIASSVTTVTDASGKTTLSPLLGPVSIIGDQARFWNAIYAAAEKAKLEGNVGIDSFVKLDTVDVTVFERYDGYAREDLPMIMRRINGFYDMGR